jgi:hypothetical protein
MKKPYVGSELARGGDIDTMAALLPDIGEKMKQRVWMQLFPLSDCDRYLERHGILHRASGQIA